MLYTFFLRELAGLAQVAPQTLAPRRGPLDTAPNRLMVLRPRQAQIIEFQYFGVLTVAEITQLLGLSVRRLVLPNVVADAGPESRLPQDYDLECPWPLGAARSGSGARW